MIDLNIINLIWTYETQENKYKNGSYLKKENELSESGDVGDCSSVKEELFEFRFSAGVEGSPLSLLLLRICSEPEKV